MAKLCNLARMTTATTGTGTVTLGVAVSGFLSFANAGVANNDIVFYGIKDGASSEVGWGTYASAGTTLTRNVIKSTNSNAAITLSGSAEVYITALASDGGDLLPGFTNPMRGFDLPLNLQLNASVASNILTVSVKGNNGSDPSNSNPVLIPFRDPTAANGGPIWRSVTAALSINTNAAGATLGTANGVPFRLWVVAFDNAGTVVLALWQSVTGGASPTAIAPLNEAAVATTTGISAAATSAGTFYTPNGTSLTGKSFRILGHLDYASGLTTAGTYASAPTTIQLFGPGIKKPGDTVQAAYSVVAASETISSTTFVATTNFRISITPTSAPNLVSAMYMGVGNSNGGTQAAYSRWSRGTTNNTNLFGAEQNVSPPVSGGASGGLSSFGLDAPGTTSSTTYTVQSKVSSATITLGNGEPSAMMLTEIMV